MDPAYAYGRAARHRPGMVRRTLRLAALASTALLALAIIGYLVRDRTWWVALLMYLPLPLLALFTIVAQLAALERARWKRRVFVIAVAAVAGAMSIGAMRGGGGGGGGGLAGSTSGAMRIVQWNVQWGRDEAGWRETVAQIEKCMPDIVILSEAPSDEKVAALCARLGGDWTFNVSRNKAGGRYWYAFAVLSRWPISEAHYVPLPNGAAHDVQIATPHRLMRVLGVDGMSSPKISRTPLLAAVAEDGENYEIIAGDFNAVSRSVGFAAIEAKGFTLASRSCSGWRGTYPAKMPMYDIDHVWLGTRLLSGECIMLDSVGTNHRGQLVHIVVAK